MATGKRLALSILGFLSLAGGARGDYRVVDLGTLMPGGGSEGLAINGEGWTTGRATVLSAGGRTAQHVFREAPGGPIRDMHLQQAAASSEGYAINNNGQLAGANFSASGVSTAFMTRTDGEMVPVGSLAGYDSSSVATAINNNGQVAGYSTNAYGFSQAFRTLTSGGLENLGSLGGPSSQAFAMNDSGHVVGTSQTGGFSSHAFITRDGGGLLDLGVLPGSSYSAGLAINDRNQVVGVANDATGARQAVLFRDTGGPLDLGTLSGGLWSVAQGINDLGEVVGQSDSLDGPHAFLWTRDRGMIDLNRLLDPGSGWTLLSAGGINDLGEIVGLGSYNGEVHALRLDPPIVHSTPAPASLVLLSLGGLVAGAWGRRRRSRPIA